MENSQNIKSMPQISSERLVSVDVFRGMTMAGMILVINPGSWKYKYSILSHANWNGCTFADLIFPFFLFIVGMSIVFALSKVVEKGLPKKDLYLKIVKRAMILFFLGLFLNAFPEFKISEFRLMGVLQRIALCYLIVSIIILHTNLRGQVIWTVSLLFVYWALMAWIPVPGVGAGHFEKNANFATYFDRFFLTGVMGYYEKLGEPEGIISTLTSLSSTLFGVLTAQLLKKNISKMEKTFTMLIPGVLFILLGILWGHLLPINKHLWTSSYVILTTGYALVIFAVLYYLIDIKGYQKGFRPFLAFGTNAITVYVLSIVLARLIKIMTFTIADGTEYHLRSWLYDKALQPLLGNLNASVAWALLYIPFWYGIMLIFYKRKIFIKI